MKNTKGKEEYKYRKIYERKGIMTKKGGYVGEYGTNPTLDKKWDRYGHANEGSPHMRDVLSLGPVSMVDVGCGFNEFINTIRRMMPTKQSAFVGTDIACPGADIIAPAHNLPFESDAFDMVVSFDCMEHIPEEEVSLAVQEFKRVARRIYLKISLTESPTRIDGEPVHVCVRTPAWWLETIREHFPGAHVRSHNRKNTPWENIIVYAEK